MTTRPWVVVIVLLLPALAAGCLGGREGSLATASHDLQGRPVVVALLDSGVNAAHVAFAGSGATSATEWAAAFGAEPIPIPGANPQESPLERERLYALNGTRVFGISFGFDSTPVILDARGHGTGTASLVARDAPGALIVMVQVEGKGCTFDADVSCFVDDSVARGMEWAAAQPWIDIISVSIGMPANKPRAEPLEPEAERYLTASRAAVASGKLVVNSAGNDPTVSHTDYFDGPPWIIAVGGANMSQRGASTQGSLMVDVVANFTESVAVADGAEGYTLTSGTSLSTPIVAATLARALSIANDAGWGPDATDEPLSPARAAALRGALNATAVAWGPTDFSPPDPSVPPLEALQSSSIPILAAGTQDGWGFAHAGLAEAIAIALRDGTGPSDPVRTAIMANAQSRREMLWG